MMEFKKSPLLFQEFVVVDSHLETVFDAKTKKCELSQILIDIDFEILTSSEKENVFNVAINLSGNEIENPESGYKFNITANGIFELTDFDEFDKNKVDQFLLYSALPILISSVRNYLLNITSYAPHGKYLLPAIDLRHLIHEKIQNKNDEKPLEYD